ncbi:potassium transporter TrkA [Acidobacteria bacterium Mor1]|nr:potassium transporter TrkA [Acidobacteria bacterium Mor1]
MSQILVFAVLAVALILFIWGRWRYDLVALLALLALAIPGIVPANQVFSGFGHPAVITVAAVLIVSRGLTRSGVVELISKLLDAAGDRPVLQLTALCIVCAVCSAFMNNVGALALLMPVALQMARRSGTSPSLLLMPLAFSSLLGGMTTLIGTPPNIIIGSYRAEVADEPFGLFDFGYVGLGVMLAGMAFIILGGWRLIPLRKKQASTDELFELRDYTTELSVPPESRLDGARLKELGTLTDVDVVVATVLRGDEKFYAPSGNFQLRGGDSLIVEIDPESLGALLKATGLAAESQRDAAREQIEGEETALFEAVISPGSRLVGRSPTQLELRAHYGLNLVALSRHGSRIVKRLRDMTFRPGDVMLLQSADPDYRDTLGRLGALPLAPRELSLSGASRHIAIAATIFAATVVALIFGWLPAQTAFTAAAVAMVLTGVVTLRDAYRNIEWPVIVLLGAMLPVGSALESSGGAAWIAERLASVAVNMPLPLTLMFLLVVTMFLSDVMNNAATAVIMAPISVSVATTLGVGSDPFLMAVAVGASCAFLTPIGHQSNTLVMGPGGYRFGDYWRLGLPLELVIVVISVPLLLWAWSG